MRKSLIVAALFLAACAAVRQTTPTPAKPAPTRFKNLRVLPSNISRKDLIVIMRAWSHSLGVGCVHCHVEPTPQPGVEGKADFVSDAKPEKNVARAMVRMTHRLNTREIEPVAAHGTSVSCYTCHRGRIVPESTLPPTPAS